MFSTILDMKNANKLQPNFFNISCAKDRTSLFNMSLTVNLRRDTNAILKSDNSYYISTLKPTAIVIYVRT